MHALVGMPATSKALQAALSMRPVRRDPVVQKEQAGAKRLQAPLALAPVDRSVR